MMTLAAPWALLLLPLPWLVWRFAPPYRERVPALRIPFFRRVTAAAGLQEREGAVVLERRRIQMIAAIAIWGLVVVALARPERLGDPITIETNARDVVLALDISGSMDERDFQAPDGSRMQRLEAVKEVISAFIASRDGDRIALIIFGTRAFVQAPFTEDLDGLAGFLDQTVVGMAGPNTAIGDAIGLSIRTFEASEVDQRLMVLLSDGADTSSRMTPINAAAIAADKGVTIFTVGVGDPEATGDDRVDLDALEKIAKMTDGAFFFADDLEALEDVYARIDEQNPRVVESTSFRPREPLSHIPLMLAFAILLGTLLWLRFTPTRRVA